MVSIAIVRVCAKINTTSDANQTSRTGKNKLTKTMELPTTMKAVVFDGPHKVSLQDRAVPTSMFPQIPTVVIAGDGPRLTNWPSQGWSRYHCQSTSNSTLRVVSLDCPVSFTASHVWPSAEYTAFCILTAPASYMCIVATNLPVPALSWVMSLPVSLSKQAQTCKLSRSVTRLYRRLQPTGR